MEHVQSGEAVGRLDDEVRVSSGCERVCGGGREVMVVKVRSGRGKVWCGGVLSWLSAARSYPCSAPFVLFTQDICNLASRHC